MTGADAERTFPSRMMQMGDRVLVEAVDREPFEATVRFCRGWSLVHGVMDWQMSYDDGSEFVYSIHIDAPVEIVTKDQTQPEQVNV